MNDSFIKELRTAPDFSSAILSKITLESDKMSATLHIVTDKSYTYEDENFALTTARKYVPDAFLCNVSITKLTPDCEMVAAKLNTIIAENYKALSATLTCDDVKVEKTEDGFSFTVFVISTYAKDENIPVLLANKLKTCFCGNFTGKFIDSGRTAEDLPADDDNEENEAYIMPIRSFKIADFNAIDSAEKAENAIYISDLNFISEKVIICGTVTDIRERTYGKENNKVYFVFSVNDTTAATRVTYFPRQKNVERTRGLKIGDGIVFTGKTELFNGYLRFTANAIDYGKVPENFVPEKRPSKPVPKNYSCIKPEPFSDNAQTNLFDKDYIPDCLKENSFVVFDLETTGLNSVASSGNMDKIIEIGAYKIENGEICRSFNTFVNPQCKLSDEIIKLTGISENMLKDAPTCEQVMPDFFKFCNGCILVGHNMANFDFKFVDYYCSKLGYVLERRIIDTIALSQELLFLSNYKLNTVADHFGIDFNHHRAADDAYVTAKIFIELIKMKKSLPNTL